MKKVPRNIATAAGAAGAIVAAAEEDVTTEVTPTACILPSVATRDRAD